MVLIAHNANVVPTEPVPQECQDQEHAHVNQDGEEANVISQLSHAVSPFQVISDKLPTPLLA